MIQYPDSYFKDEIRCGFRVTELMKHCWAAQIEVLEEIERICKKYNLQYFAHGGTLLGAVRHKGFIPWDDDMDIAMKRKDYIVLMQILVKELPEYYDIYSIYNRPDWSNTFGRVVNTKKLPMEESQIEKFHGFFLPAGVDIFPIDFVPRDNELAEVQRALLNLTWRMIKNLIKDSDGSYNEEERKIVGDEIKEAIGVLAEFCSIPSFENRSILQIFQLIFEQLCMLGNAGNSDYCAVMSTFYDSGYKYRLKKEWYEKEEEMAFEYGKIKIPCGYDSILTEYYQNYMRYIKGEQGHGYPYYQKAISLLKRQNLLTMKVDPKDEGQMDEERVVGNVAEVPNEWKERVAQARGEGRRVVLFQPMLTSMLAKEEKYIEAVDELLTLFLNNPRILIWFRPHVNEHVPYADIRPELFEQYFKICEKFRKFDNIIYDITENQLGANEMCDIYIGDDSPISEEFRNHEKEFYFIDLKRNEFHDFVKLFQN